jgi:L-2-hydroxycarboxylate dehydrogenase (NAD+)
MDYSNNGHKAHALPSGVLVTSSFGSSTNSTSEIPERSVGKGIGHFFGAMQIDGFIDKDEFKKQIDDWIHVFRNTKPAPGTNGPLIPGDPEREAEAIRIKEGIPLLKPVVDDLLDISRKTGIQFKSK